MLSALMRGLDKDALHKIQDGIGSSLTNLNAIGLEAERERAAHLSSGPETGPLLRTTLRLRHDLVMIGRASGAPLPSQLQARLAPSLTKVRDVFVAYLHAMAAALRSSAGAPAIWPVHEALQAYAAEVTAMRNEGMMRGQPGEVMERIFALGFCAGADAAKHERPGTLCRRMVQYAGRGSGRPQGPGEHGVNFAGVFRSLRRQPRRTSPLLCIRQISMSMRSWPKNGSFSNTKVGTPQWPEAAWSCSLPTMTRS